MVRTARVLDDLKRDAVLAADKPEEAVGVKHGSQVHDVGRLGELVAAIKRADAEKKPLFIVIGMTCHDAPEIHKSFPDAVWVHVGDSFNGNSTPRLLVRPVGSPTGMPFLLRNFGPDTPA